MHIAQMEGNEPKDMTFMVGLLIADLINLATGIQVTLPDGSVLLCRAFFFADVL